MTTGPTREDDTGSVTPLIVGMLLCILLLGAAVTAAGSAFLAGQTLQHMCDGAAATAADMLTDNPGSTGEAADRAAAYLGTNGNHNPPGVAITGTTISVTCTSDDPITFGALFHSPTLHRVVTATAHTAYRQP